MEESEIAMINELVKALTTKNKEGLDIHKKLLIESQKTNQIYVQILSAIRHQNVMLDDLKESGRVVTVSN